MLAFRSDNVSQIRSDIFCRLFQDVPGLRINAVQENNLIVQRHVRRSDGLHAHGLILVGQIGAVFLLPEINLIVDDHVAVFIGNHRVHDDPGVFSRGAERQLIPARQAFHVLRLENDGFPQRPGGCLGFGSVAGQYGRKGFPGQGERPVSGLHRHKVQIRQEVDAHPQLILRQGLLLSAFRRGHHKLDKIALIDAQEVNIVVILVGLLGDQQLRPQAGLAVGNLDGRIHIREGFFQQRPGFVVQLVHPVNVGVGFIIGDGQNHHGIRLAFRFKPGNHMILAQQNRLHLISFRQSALQGEGVVDADGSDGSLSRFFCGSHAAQKQHNAEQDSDDFLHNVFLLFHTILAHPAAVQSAMKALLMKPTSPVS